MKIRWRLALYAATVTFGSVLVFATLLFLLGSATSVEEHEKGLRTSLATALEGYSTLDLPDLKNTTSAFLVDSPSSLDMFFVGVNSSGVVEFATGQINQTPPDVPAALILETLSKGESIAVSTQNGVEMRMISTPWPKAWLGDGVLVAMQPVEFATRQLANLRILLWIAGIISVASTTIVAWFVSGRAVRPLTKLAETTDAIAATGDLSQRLPSVRASDELGRLTTSFNAMVSSLEKAREQVGESLSAQRRFVGDASHELRSPLTTILNNAGFLMDRPNATDDDRAEAIADICLEADRMALLVDDLLLLARGDEGLALVERPADLTLIAKTVARRSERAGTPIELDVPTSLVVMGDETQLERMLWILVDNATRHGRPPLALSLASVGDIAAVEMTDSGDGFPLDNPTEVFTRFFQADPSRSQGGSGLGLSIAQWIVEAHHGSISAINRPGGGGLVKVELPRA